jgi:hypothetical protein
MSGDTVKCSEKGIKTVLTKTKLERSSSITIAIKPTVLSNATKPAKTLNLLVHHAILHTLDPSNELFECPQKFTAYVGYVCKATKNFVRPGDHCNEVKEQADKDGDCLLPVCKTDVDHMLGYHFNNVFCLWRCNHQVNQWLHQTRGRAGIWLHPYFNAIYEEENKGNPPYFDSLPPTLTPTSLKNKPEEWMRVLKAYKDKHGDCNVPQRHIETYMECEWKLGSWLDRQRNAKKKGDLDEVVETEMTDLGVKWDKNKIITERWIFLLKAFKVKHGNFDVPQHHIMEYMERKKDLGRWLNKQRNAKKKNVLDKDVETEMKNLGVVL